MAGSLATATVSAQPGGHPHIAPLAPGFSLLSPVKKISPLLNYPDEIWNLGESTEGVDKGGALGAEATPLTTPTFVPLLAGTGGWSQHTQPSLQRYAGSFRRPPPSIPADDTRASFELVAPPASSVGNLDIVVSIWLPTTFGPADTADEPYHPHVYPGKPSYNDLLFSGSADEGHVKMALRFANHPQFRVVGVQFTPRTSYRPMVFLMQRLRQVRMAVIQVLGQPPYSIPPSKIAFHVAGYSFGGFLAPLATIFYPQEFHSATGVAYSAAHRSMPSDFDAFVFLTSLLGADSSGAGYTLRDAVEIPMWCQQELTDFASVSFTNRWVRGHIQRPVYFLVGDEDPVTHGTDWVSILHGIPSAGQVQMKHGRATRTRVNGGSVTVRWSVVPKTCHEGDPPDVYVLEGLTTTKDTSDLTETADVMIEAAHLERAATVLPIGDSALGRKLSASGPFPSLDPSQPALGHTGNRLSSAFSRGTHPTLLEKSNLVTHGQGTWLGHNESLKVVSLPGESDGASVFVGSADGWVTRLKMTTITSAPPPVLQPLVEVARTTKGNAHYALGHGTWGLDVGEVDTSFPGLEVVVASYDRLALFHAASLVLIREVVLPNWEWTRPSRLQVADLWGGSELEIVFRTQHNHLVVMDKNLQVLRDYGEGGIIDLVVGPVPQRVGAWMHRPIYLLSARGHLARLEINNTGMPIAELAAASTLQYGLMRDLDLVTWQGQTRLAALFVPHPTELPAVRLFSVDDLTQVGGFGNVMQQLPPPVEGEPTLATIHATATGDMAPTLTEVKGPSGSRYVIASGGDLSVWDGVGLLGHKRLSLFRATRGYGCVQAGDIDPSTPGDEVVVSTTGGRVAWFKLSELEGGGLSIPAVTPRVYADASGSVYEHRCNVSITATWAMAAQPASGSTPGVLRVVDPGGSLWQVDPLTGRPVWQKDMGVGGTGLVSARAPGGFVAGTGGTDPRWQMIPNGASDGLLLSAPYVPNTSPNPTTPWWTPPSGWEVPVQLVQGHWFFPSGGDVYTNTANGKVWCAWWQRYGSYANLLLCASYSVSGTAGATVQSLWSSTLTNNGGLPPPRWPQVNFVKPLRTEASSTTLQNLQALRIGKVIPGLVEPQVVVCAMGGRVMLLSNATPTTGRIVAESEDLGLGSPALAVADLNGDGVDEVLVATTYSPIPASGGTVRSYLHVLKYAAPDRLDRIGNPVAIGDHADFYGYGACGIAVGEVPIPQEPAIPKGIYVATLNGELVIFKPDGSGQGSIDPVPLFRTVVEGSIGAFNSIHVANLDPGHPKPEVYLAGSSGIRRFDFQ